MLNTLMIKSTLIVFACCASFAAHARADTPKQVSVPAGELVSALESLAKQAAVDLVYQPEQLKAFRTSGVKGTYTPEGAIRILLKGTPLELRTDPSGAMVIAPPHTLSTLEEREGAHDSGKGEESEKDRLQLAQTNTSGPSSSQTVEKSDESSDKNSRKQIQLEEEVVVTGSRIPTTAKEGAQEVKIFTREQIEQSGQTTVADFLNTLPIVSTAVTEGGQQTPFGGTTVQLRGLPYGTTLVLINGRRVETSGSQSSSDFFDLNNIPLAAVERIDVVADGSSAIYGSDAIAGVVNIILKKNFDGLEFNAKESWAKDIQESDTSVAFGRRWDKGSVSLIGSYQSRGELTNTERMITSSSDYTSFGGPNNNFPVCNPGNVFSSDGNNLPGLNSSFAAVPAGYTGKPSVEEFKGTAGTLNECAIFTGLSLIPASHRTGLLAEGNYELTPYVELFAELLYSHVQQYLYFNYQGLFGIPGFQEFTVSASNPYNPFGTTVGVTDLFTTVPRVGNIADTVFFRPLAGAKGRFLSTWQWEVSAWDSKDSTNDPQPNFIANGAGIQNALNSSNPATALNPFVAGPPGSQSLLQSFYTDAFIKFSGRDQGVNGFARGQVIQLPSGPIELVLGGEYSHGTLFSDQVIPPSGGPPNVQATFRRDSYAIFAEGRIPILANPMNRQAGDTLAVSVAGRRDRYNDFGAKNTPQVGIEWRPLDTLLIRATYAEAFKAPPLFDLHSPRFSAPAVITDPLTGQLDQANIISGGNANLRPETGQSHTFGVVYSSQAIPNLRMSVTNWNMKESNTIENVPFQVILDNPGLFPGDVVRASNCSGGTPCPITTIVDTLVNFGQFSVAGFDYQLNYQYRTSFGVLTPVLSATETYHYGATLTPGTLETDRVSKANDDGNFAPRWKGAAALSWRLGPYTANVDGRYVGRYRDYDSTREIGNFWLCDANLRYAVGESLASNNRWLKGVYVDVGGVNLFNRLPQFSNYGSGLYGYDPTQADIRGRLLYAQLRARL